MSDSTDSKSESDAPAPEAKAKKTPVKPTKAAKKPAAKKSGKGDERRSFFISTFDAAFYGLCSVFGLWGLSTLRFMMPNALAEPPSQFNAGPPDQFEPGQVYTQWKNTFGVWIINLAKEGRLIALSTTCTHLGCTPSWLEAEQKFKCPCHGSGFYKTGVNFEGPAPRPLERYRIIEVDGIVVVDKSKKFQAELNQWDEPESFLPV